MSMADDSAVDFTPDEKLRQWEYFGNLRSILLEDLVKEGDSCYDVVLVQVGNVELSCHRLILICNSAYFAALFRNNITEAEQKTFSLPTEYVSENAFTTIHDALYEGDLKIDENNLKEVLIACSYLQLTYFINRCKDYICQNIDHIDVCELIMIRQLQLDSLLYELVKKFVAKNFSELHQRLVGVSFGVLQELFSDQDFCVSSKEILLNFGRNWICHDLQNRKRYLREISGILKPFHTPSEQSSKFLSILEEHLDDDADIDKALGLALDLAEQYDNLTGDCGLIHLNSLFFVQPNKNSEMRIATLEDESLIFNPLQLPNIGHGLVKYEGCVTNDIFYVSAITDGKNNDVNFRGIGRKEHGWIELSSPREMPECLITCNSTVYSYEQSFKNRQFSAFEPILNRWLKVPPVKYPREKAGIASNGTILFTVGGIPQDQINTPENIVEMFDYRCKSWSQITISAQPLKIKNVSYSKRICCWNNCLYLFPFDPVCTNLSALDLRNNKWQFFQPDSILADEPGYAIAVKGEIWFVYDSLNYREIRCFNPRGGELLSSISSYLYYSCLKPIMLPYLP